MLTSCPAAVATTTDDALADAGIVAASAPRGRGRDATLDGTSTNRNVAPANAPRPQTAHSSPAADTAATQNLPRARLGAGPRPASPRQLQQRRPPLVPAVVADIDDFVLADAPGPGVSCASAGWPATAASAVPPSGNQRCNNGFADGLDGTAVRTPSVDSAADAEIGSALVPDQTTRDTEVGPRECRLPGSSLEAELPTPLRGVLMGTSVYAPQNNLGKQ